MDCLTKDILLGQEIKKNILVKINWAEIWENANLYSVQLWNGRGALHKWGSGYNKNKKQSQLPNPIKGLAIMAKYGL